MAQWLSEGNEPGKRLAELLSLTAYPMLLANQTKARHSLVRRRDNKSRAPNKSSHFALLSLEKDTTRHSQWMEGKPFPQEDSQAVGQAAQRGSAVTTVDLVPSEQLPTPAVHRWGSSEEPIGSFPSRERCLGVSGWLEAHTPAAHREHMKPLMPPLLKCEIQTGKKRAR